VTELKAATAKVFDTMGRDVLQYSTSEGFTGLREIIARRYHERQNLDIPVEDILITNGSQQGLDLMGKTFIMKVTISSSKSRPISGQSRLFSL